MYYSTGGVTQGLVEPQIPLSDFVYVSDGGREGDVGGEGVIPLTMDLVSYVYTTVQSST